MTQSNHATCHWLQEIFEPTVPRCDAGTYSNCAGVEGDGRPLPGSGVGLEVLARTLEGAVGEILEADPQTALHPGRIVPELQTRPLPNPERPRAHHKVVGAIIGQTRVRKHTA